MLNVPYWADSTTEVFSLTLVSGPCSIPYEDSLQYQSATQQGPAIPGCNMRSVDNKTLVPTLLRDATNVSTVPLLIRVMSNVTLGVGITRSIPIRRPIVLLGMVSSLTSIDMGMVVNQLNVTLPYGKITWQSVVLENLAPGERVSWVSWCRCAGKHAYYHGADMFACFTITAHSERGRCEICTSMPAARTLPAAIAFQAALADMHVCWCHMCSGGLRAGDAVSAVTAAPYSTTVWSNVWAMYCNRCAVLSGMIGGRRAQFSS
jgi:hypothetical protein